MVQTGVQLLTGFLLTLPFQPRFDGLSAAMRVVYLVTVGCSVGATVLLEAPVAIHRLLFRRHRTAMSWCPLRDRLAYSGLLLMGVALTGVAVIIFGAVAGRSAGSSPGDARSWLKFFFWVVLPLWVRRHAAASKHV